jgi:hypothetical protein
MVTRALAPVKTKERKKNTALNNKILAMEYTIIFLFE